MTSDREHSWWLIAPDDPDLEMLRDSVIGSDWAVFAADDEEGAATPPVALRIAQGADGRMICTALIVGLHEAFEHDVDPREVNSRSLRTVRLNELIGRAIHDRKVGDYDGPMREVILERAPKSLAVKRNPGPRGHPIEHFERVAEMYRRALVESPGRPVVWLTEQLHADRSTVTRWLKRARVEGLLGEASPGRAGEVNSPSVVHRSGDRNG